MASIVDKSENFNQFRGFQPAADNLGMEVREYVLEEMTPDYVRFMQARLAKDCVDYMGSYVIGNFVDVGRISEKPFYVTDRDMGVSGAEGGAYALVKPGKKDKPLKIILAHTDVPCLKVLPQPIHIETDADNSLAYPSFGFSTEPYGGLRADDWYGIEIDIIGSIFQNGRERKIHFPGRIKQKSVHVESGEEKSLSMLKVDIGMRTLKEIYKKFEIKDAMDFGRAGLYAVPHFADGANGRLVGNELGGYGHDDRACLWASTMVGLESICSEDNENTFLIFGLNREEVGSTGNTAGYRGFFEAVLKETLKVVHGKDAWKFDLPLDLQRGLLGKFPAISADTDVALGDQEIADISTGMIDLQNSAKSGWGVYVAAHSTGWGRRNVSPKHIDLLMSLFDKKFPGKNKRDRYQIIGNCNTPDSDASGGTLADIFDQFFPCIDMGVSIIGLHNPHSESLNVFDLYWTKKAYETYLRA